MLYALCLVSHALFITKNNMPMILENLDVWKRAVTLAKNIRKLCKDNSHLKNDYGMKDQIQRSATSIASNIAEWNDRQSDKEFIRYLIIARGSTSELKTQLYIIEEDIPKDTFTELSKEIIGIHKMLNSFIKTLNK